MFRFLVLIMIPFVSHLAVPAGISEGTALGFFLLLNFVFFCVFILIDEMIKRL